MYHQEKQDYKRALKDFLIAAKMGNMYAQNNVGFYYMTGKAGTTDLNLARRYLQQAADQGYAQSDNHAAYPRRIFISKIIDPAGNALSYTFVA